MRVTECEHCAAIRAHAQTHAPLTYGQAQRSAFPGETSQYGGYVYAGDIGDLDRGPGAHEDIECLDCFGTGRAQ